MPKALSRFSNLNSQVSIYHPPLAVHHTTPCLIIMCAWAFAASRHLQKYITAYHRSFPEASILLIRSKIGDMLWTSDEQQYKALEPAVRAIQAFHDTHAVKEEEASPPPKVLMHVFSNAGSHAGAELSEAWTKYAPMSWARSERARSPSLPIDGLILDSAPGHFSMWRSVAAIVQGGPKHPVFRVLLAALAWTFLLILKMLEIVGLYENSIEKTREVLNELTFLEHEGAEKVGLIPRLYLYSEGDVMVLAQDVVEHAEEAHVAMAKLADVVPVSAVEFEGSVHVQHACVDEKRYWSSVIELLGGLGVTSVPLITDC